MGGDFGGGGEGKGESVRVREAEGLFPGFDGLRGFEVVSSASMVGGEYGAPTQLNLKVCKTWEN